MKILILTLLLSLSVHANDEKISNSKTFTVPIGQPHKIDEKLQVLPIKIVNDSRCPLNAQCITEGQITVEIVFAIGEKSDQMKFTPTHGIGKAVELVDLPISQSEKDKNFVEAFKWNNKTYRVKNVLPYPHEKGDPRVVFEEK